MGLPLQGKRLILGVSGGIAAYKSVELLRFLTAAEARVRVVMTRNARRFVGALTFQALCGRPVFDDLFEHGGSDQASIRHIEWAQEADAVVIAPATANVLGKLANGIADDALSTFMLAINAPVMLCPAMNSQMYLNAQVQRNIKRLQKDGYHVLPPDSGQLACGTTGPGRLPDPALIFNRFVGLLTPPDLRDRRVLVTAGPTWEPIDPVRFIANPSSGKMGYAIAQAAEQRGAETALISGPSPLPDPPGVTVVRVQTAAEMHGVVLELAKDSDIVIKAAAVSDYRTRESVAHKIKKSRDTLSLELVKNPDILRELGRQKQSQNKSHQVLVGFAAETQSLHANAVAKLRAKNLDMIVGNIVGQPGSGFQSDTNQVTLFHSDGSQEALASMAKEAVAHALLDRIVQRYLDLEKK